MAFIDYFSLEHLLNLSLFGVVILVWLVLNNWINKNLERFLKQKGWLVEGREKNIKKLIKQVLLLTLTTLVCSFTGLVLGAYGLFFYGNFFENILTPPPTIFVTANVPSTLPKESTDSTSKSSKLFIRLN